MTFWEGEKLKKPDRWELDPSLVAPEWQYLWSIARSGLAVWEGGGSSIYDYAQREAATYSAVSGGIFWQIGKFGWRANGLIASQRFVSIPNVGRIANDTEATIFITVNLGVWTANHPVLTINDSGTNNNIFRIQTTGTTGQLQILNKDTADNYRFTVDVTTEGAALNMPFVLAFRVGPSGNQVYVNGIPLTGTYSTGSAGSPEWLSVLSNLDKWELLIQRLTSTVAADHRIISYFHVFRGLPDALIEKVSRDPFGLFRMADEVGVVIAGAAANPHGPLGHPLWGPLAGPVAG